MGAVDKILAARKNSIWKRFRLLRSRKFRMLLKISASAPEALQLAYQEGLQEGYGEGLIDGVDLGMDVGLNISLMPALTSSLPLDLS